MASPGKNYSKPVFMAGGMEDDILIVSASLIIVRHLFFDLNAPEIQFYSKHGTLLVDEVG